MSTHAVLIPVSSEALTIASVLPVSSFIRRVVAGSPGTLQSGFGAATILIEVAELYQKMRKMCASFSLAKMKLLRRETHFIRSCQSRRHVQGLVRFRLCSYAL